MKTFRQVWMAAVFLVACHQDQYLAPDGDAASDASVDALGGDAGDSGGTGDGGDGATTDTDAHADGATPDTVPADGSGDATGGDTAADAPTVDPSILAPRPIAPMSTANVTSRRPTLRWVLPAGVDGAVVELCADRACARTIATMRVAGSSGMPSGDLPTGVVFWRARGQVGGAVGVSYGPTWEFFVPVHSAPTSTSWGTVPDVNGDGVPDVLVSDNLGGTYVFLGTSAGAVPTPVVLTAESSHPVSQVSLIASAGDVDGDGFGDVLTLTPDGGHLVFYGDAAGTLSRAPSGGGRGGTRVSIASLGDLDGDGYGDIGYAEDNSAFVVRGGAAGLGAPVSTWTSSSLTEQFAIGGLGDLTGDGTPDVGVTCVECANTLQVFTRFASVQTQIPDVSSTTGGGRYLGTLGDVNGDGLGDMFIGSHNTGGSGSAVFLGHASGPAIVWSEQVSVPGVAPLVALGDVNGDGFDDVGARDLPAYVFDVFLGGSAGFPATHATLSGPTGTSFGSGGGVGDVDGDGFSDVWIGDPNPGTGNPLAAASAYLYRGGAGGLATTATSAVHGSSGSGLGFAVATLAGVDAW